MKKTFLILSAAFAVACGNVEQAESQNQSTENVKTMKDFYSLKSETLEGEPFDFSTLKGKRVIIVNTASECGYTPQYADLQKLYEEYKGENFEIIGFPANDFGQQEPGSAEEIKSFCQKNYGVTFPMMHKIVTKGEKIDPVYEWLTSASVNGVSDAEVKWNFHKFLIDENGKWVASLTSDVNPMDDKIIQFVKGN